MPYKIKMHKEDDATKHCVYKINESPGEEDERLKCYDEHAPAEAYLAALRIAESEEGKSISFDSDLIESAHAIKILSETDDVALVGGYGVIFGGRDLQGDTFSAETDYMTQHSSDKMPVLYDHAMGDIKSVIGTVTKVEAQDSGIWMESEIRKGKQYAKQILELIRSGVLGYSTGSVAHLVERLEGQIKRWPIFELSLTATPAEPRTLGVDFLKQLGVTISDVNPVTESVKGDEPKTEAERLGIDSEEIKQTEDIEMSEEKIMEPEVKVEPVQEKVMDIKSIVKDAIKEMQAERVTESGGVLTESAPAIKSVTKMGGDHDGGDAFSHWCRTGQSNYYTKGHTETPTKADLAEGSAVTGGVLVPEDLYASIVAKRNESSIPHRAGAKIINTSLDSVQVPSEDDSSAFTLTTEGATYTTSDPSFTSNVVTVYKYTSTVQASEELLADQVANLDAFLADGWGRGLAQAYNQATLVDDGSAKPKGVCESATLGKTFSSVTATTAAELVELYHSVPDYYSEGSVWIMRNVTLGALRALTGNPFSFIPTPQGSAPYGDLYGKPVLLSDKMAAPTAGNISIVVGNWSFYALVERSSLEVFRDPYSAASTGQVNFYCKARFGGTTIIPDAFRKGVQAAS